MIKARLKFCWVSASVQLPEATWLAQTVRGKGTASAMPLIVAFDRLQPLGLAFFQPQFDLQPASHPQRLKPRNAISLWHG
jgi:hypothetical protein